MALIENFAKEKGLEWTYSPKYNPTPNFVRLLLLRIEGKLDYATTFHLLGNILHAIFADSINGAKERLGWIFKTLIVAFAPMPILWRVYPNTRPVSKANPRDLPADSLAVGK
jgi:hypothetical protein